MGQVAWLSSFPADMIWDVAVLSRDVSGTQTPLWMTRGGNRPKRNHENRQVPFDGARVPIAGLDRGIGGRPEFSGIGLQLDETVAGILNPGSTTVTAGTPATSTITPVAHDIAIAKTDMILLPRLTWARSGGGTVYMEFPYGFVAEWDLESLDKSEGEVSYRIESRLDPAAVGFTIADPGYVIKVIDPT